MTATTRYEDITSQDGQQFVAFCAIPESGHGPGVILFQEILGINDNMRTVAEDLAKEGFVTLVPDMFWRLEPRFERKDESGFGDAMALMQKFDFGAAVADIHAVHAHLLAMPECTGTVGAIGFCLGGGFAYVAATTSRVDGRGPDAAVCYYGSAINDLLGQVDQLECPTMFHYGNDDPFITGEKVSEVEAAVVDHPGVVFHRYDGAGHAFSNWDAPSMYRQEASDLAWARSLAFLHQELS